jgi:hypothetical protein
MSDRDVRHDPEATTFFIDLEDAEAVLVYRPVGDKVLDFEHTYVPPQYRGHGLAATLAREAFEYARQNGYRVIPSCPYITTYLKRHPEYESLVADG